MRIAILALVALFSTNVQAEYVELICKNFAFGMSVGGVTPAKNTSITYEKIAISDASGVRKNIFAPSRIITIQQFWGTTASAGARGEHLANGQCGLVKGSISGVSTDPRSGKPYIQFNDFSSSFVQVGQGAMSPVGVQVAVNLPPCASGIRKFRANMENPNSFFLNDGPTNVMCVE